MALDTATAQEMRKQLADDRIKYFDTLSRAHDVLAQALTAASSCKPPLRLTTEAFRRNTGALSASLEVESVSKDSGKSIEEESDTEDDVGRGGRFTIITRLFDASRTLEAWYLSFSVNSTLPSNLELDSSKRRGMACTLASQYVRISRGK